MDCRRRYGDRRDLCFWRHGNRPIQHRRLRDRFSTVWRHGPWSACPGRFCHGNLVLWRPCPGLAGLWRLRHSMECRGRGRPCGSPFCARGDGARRGSEYQGSNFLYATDPFLPNRGSCDSLYGLGQPALGGADDRLVASDGEGHAVALRHNLNSIELVCPIRRIIEVERGGAGRGYDRTNWDKRIIQIRRGKDLVVDIGRAIPYDQLIAGIDAGDAKDGV